MIESNQKFSDSQTFKFRLDGSHVTRVALFHGSNESARWTGANFIVDAGLTRGTE